MANKPKIYANCKAGCLWETVHKDDFQRSAAFIRQSVEDNGYFKEFYLEAGQTCIVKGDIVADTITQWKVQAEVRDIMDNTYRTFNPIVRSRGDTYFRAKNCGVEEENGKTYAYYEIGDSRYQTEVSDSNIVLRLMYVDEVYLINDCMDEILTAEEVSV